MVFNERVEHIARSRGGSIHIIRGSCAKNPSINHQRDDTIRGEDFLLPGSICRMGHDPIRDYRIVRNNKYYLFIMHIINNNAIRIPTLYIRNDRDLL